MNSNENFNPETKGSTLKTFLLVLAIIVVIGVMVDEVQKIWPYILGFAAIFGVYYIIKTSD